MLGFKLSLFADVDVFNILDYTVDKWGVEQAIKYKEELEQGRRKIQKNPYLIGSKRQEELASGCRSFKVNYHFFFYRVNEKENTIEIARILHETRDFPRHVSEGHFD